ncbi:MAG: ferritin family protein [Magnetococcales bacterium]|nr:ferritin family protein [Magnetococcales bacterium]
MNSFEEIILYAIKHEEAEAAFYVSLSEQVENDDVKAAMLHHAEEEVMHKTKLLEILENHRLPSGKKRYPDPDMKMADYAFIEIDTLDVKKISYQDALLAAAKQELAAQKLYEDLAGQATDPDLKATLSFLAEQEGKHRSQLEAEYDDNILTEN